MHEVNVVDPSFDLGRTSQYYLSIQLGLDGFSFFIVDTFRNACVAFRHAPVVVEKPHFLYRKVENLLQDEKLRNPFKKVLVVYSSSSSVLVPTVFSELANAEELEAVADFSDRHGAKITEPLPGLNYQLSYSVPHDLQVFLRNQYVNMEMQHRAVPLLSCFNRCRQLKRNSLLIHFDKKHVLLVGANDSKLLLFNTYFVKSEYDSLFYTLNAWRTLKFDAENDELFISGWVGSNSSFVNQIRRYLAQVSFLKPSTGLEYGKLFETVEAHQYVGLLETYQCES